MFRKQPKTEVNLSSLDKKIIRLGWVLLLLNTALILFFYSRIPDKIPTHFNLKGVADTYGPKSTIWAILGIGILLYWGLSLVLKKVPPYKHNYPLKITSKNASMVYRLSIRMMVLLNFSIACIFLFISFSTILVAYDSGYNLMPIIGVLIVFVTVLPFYFMYKMFKVPK